MNISLIEKDLWEAADDLRANSKLTATEYAQPILGIIFLSHATSRFYSIKKELLTQPQMAAYQKLVDNDRNKAVTYTENAKAILNGEDVSMMDIQEVGEKKKSFWNKIFKNGR